MDKVKKTVYTIPMQTERIEILGCGSLSCEKIKENSHGGEKKTEKRIDTGEQ